MYQSSKKIIETQKSKLEEVTKSGERYKALFEHSLAGMMKFSIEPWKVIEANAALLALCGCNTIEEFEQCFTGLPQTTLTLIKEALEKEGIVSALEIQTKRNDGKQIWLLFSAKVVEKDHQAYGVIIDITKRKLSEEKIEEQAALLNEAQDAIIATTEDGTIAFWNHGAETTYGWKSNEVLGRKMQSVFYSEDKLPTYRFALDEAVQYQEWSGEHRHRRKDHKEILVDSRWRIVQKNGKRTILVVNTDITGKKRMEAQFIKAQKMETIALLTGGIAHDLQNVLAPVALSIGLLREQLHDQTSLDVLYAVEESAQSGLQLVKNILTYGKGTIGERIDVEIGPILHQVVEIISKGLPPDILLNIVIADTSWIVKGDPMQLKQVFLNICVNARDAMPKGGRLSVKIEEKEFTGEDYETYPDAHTHTYLCASISDTGIGIPEDNLDRIFEPFFTSKEGGEGTGLGLSIVAGIVKSHGGFITVESQVNKGTSFKVFLPAIVPTKDETSSS